MKNPICNAHKPTLRVIRILQAISGHPKELTLSTLSQELAIPKSTLSPIVKTLLDSKFIKQNKDNMTYDIGVSIFTMGAKYLTSISWIDIAKSYMKIIVEECNEICQLGVLDNDRVTYIAKVNSEQPVKLMSSIGKTLPLYCTALGRIFLSEYTDESIRTLYANGLKKYNENTITDIEEIIKIVHEVRASGFSNELGETTADVQCIAVPLISNNVIIGAISVSLPKFRATNQKLETILTALRKYSQEISIHLKNYQ